MRNLCLAALMAVSALPAQAQTPAAQFQVQPSVDSPAERESMREFVTCLAQARPAWARDVLSHPYLSTAQASAASEVLAGRDKCLRVSEKEMTFRTSTLVAALAEYFVRSELKSTDPKLLASAVSTAPPLNASEDFALCIAAHDLGAATDLTLSEPGSPAESKAVSAVGAYIPACINSNEHLSVDAQSLRALVSAALYRGLTAVRTRQ
jgi:hypothetical protein